MASFDTEGQEQESPKQNRSGLVHHTFLNYKLVCGGVYVSEWRNFPVVIASR